MEDRCYTGAPIRGNHYAPAWALPEESPFLKVLSDALSEEGLPHRVSDRPGFGTNGCHFAVERKVPTVIYGPSRRELVHGVDEYIEIRELLGACRGYYAMAGRLLSGRGGVQIPAEGAAVSEGGR
jgi:acetylornithine deacetylase/succinyl-diaminopimelate desuccinylase-like protein